ncbi:hypothetical protein HZB58_01250 [Candidatus Gottesmanbacteria bacterium]|nr:hypothetical protein [Candidatus Gottesmanbacteria bacterium]
MLDKERGGIMKAKSARAKKAAHPSESIIIQFGVAFIVVAGFALLMYAVKYFLP